jgi:hypothetical protein
MSDVGLPQTRSVSMLVNSIKPIGVPIRVETMSRLALRR